MKGLFWNTCKNAHYALLTIAEDGKEVQSETLTIKATPLSNGMVKAKTGDMTDATVYGD